MANSHLETALIADLNSEIDQDALSMMLKKAKDSYYQISFAGISLGDALKKGVEEKSPYVDGFASIVPYRVGNILGSSIVPQKGEVVAKIAAEIKGDHLAPTRRFVDDLERIKELTTVVISSLEELSVIGQEGRLKEALEQNEVTLQADFALLMTKWMIFLNEYIIDSLVATSVAFETEGHPALNLAS